MGKQVSVTRMECPRADWVRVVNAARRTRGLEPIDHEPSNAFKRSILLAEHSPIRLLEYDFTIEGVRQWVTTHLVRHHIGCEKFVSSQRQDINGNIELITNKIVELLKEADLVHDGWKARDYLFQGEVNTMDMSCNAQAFINISRKRLCHGCPSPETRYVWELVINMLGDIDPILAEKCVPECVYRGFCPERTTNSRTNRCCGWVDSKQYNKVREQYLRIDND